MTLATIIRGVKPKNAAKWLEAELGCSPRQSWRIVQEGRVASTLRHRLVSILDEAIASNEEQLRQLRRELRGLAVGTSARGVETQDQMARMAGQMDAPLPGLAERADEPFLKE